MKKTMYSLLLSEDVVREVDALAHRNGLSRSALVDRILAEYVDYTTPERRVEEILTRLGALLENDRELVASFQPNSRMMSVRSSLQYRYRPTIRYSVDLSRAHGAQLGELNVVFRTQSAELLAAMAGFFSLWKRVEDELLEGAFPQPVEYSFYDGRFTRSILLRPGREYGAQELADAICRYVRLFDSVMKQYIAGTLPPEAVRAYYLQWLAQGNLRL